MRDLIDHLDARALVTGTLGAVGLWALLMGGLVL